jgi:hypothetical protein
MVYSEVMELHRRSFQPFVKELLRGRVSNHTCAKRSTRSWIENNYPEYIIDKDFEEWDPLWKEDHSETNDEEISRLRRLLEDIFTNDDASFISLTTGSHAISAVLNIVGAPHVEVSQGVTFPLFVKATKVGQRI